MSSGLGVFFNTALPAAWREPDYDDGLWPTGTVLFYFETSALPAPKNPPLTLERTRTI
jgi:hypothetical protein